MARKRHKPEQIVAKLRQVDVLVSQGQAMADAVRQIGVSEVTCYRWRQEFRGLQIEQVRRLKEPEKETPDKAGVEHVSPLQGSDASGCALSCLLPRHRQL